MGEEGEEMYARTWAGSIATGRRDMLAVDQEFWRVVVIVGLMERSCTARHAHASYEGARRGRRGR
jgi:hypothetical protein